MASFVPIPAPRGSPQGPNQWFWGAPVVLALRPAYVTPLTVCPKTLSRKCTLLETTPAVKWWLKLLQQLITVSISLSE